MDSRKGNRAFAIFIAVLVILLVLAVALFVYASMTNGLPQPHLPGRGVFALGAMLHHG